MEELIEFIVSQVEDNPKVTEENFLLNCIYLKAKSLEN